MVIEENSDRVGKCVSKGMGLVLPAAGYENILFLRLDSICPFMNIAVGRKVLGLDDGTAVNYSYFKVFDRHTDIHEITPCRPACADRECSFSRRDFYERLLPSGL